MAFVYKSEKKWEPIGTNEKLGPGTYIGQKDYHTQKNVTPFNATSGRLEKKPEKKENTTPGPGSYEIVKDFQSEKVLVSSVNQELKIVEVPKPHSIFRSTTSRFQEKKTLDVPGPGTYQTEGNLNKRSVSQKELQRFEESQKKSVMEQLIKNSKYKSIPTIPTHVQSFGYTENETNELELNKNPLIQFTGIGVDSVGPGRYELPGSMDAKKGYSWHKSGVPRNGLKSDGFQVGPGTYDVNAKPIPLYKYRPSPGFASGTQRSFDFRKGSKANKFIMGKLQQQAKLANPDLREGQMSKFVEEEFEYVDDTNPGPGYYYNESVMTSIRVPRKGASETNHFGSSSLRFKGLEPYKPVVGPGSYESQPSIATKTKSTSSVPFLTSNQRFSLRDSADNPGPGAYQPKIQLEDKLIKKIQVGYKGNFGSQDKRFKMYDSIEQENPGPGHYIEVDNEDPEERVLEKPVKYSSNFRSETTRKIFEDKKVIPPVGSYELDVNNIAKKMQNQNEEDPDLAIKKVPFNSSQARFKGLEDINKKRSSDDEDEDSVMMQNSKSLSDFKKAKKVSAPFLGKDSRFKYEKQVKNVPGPGNYYDHNQNLWNRRTYNILFAEI